MVFLGFLTLKKEVNMDTVNAVCECKNFSEEEKVVAIRKKPLEDWGFWAWVINIILLIVTAGGWFPFLVGWVMGDYFLTPTYRCQFCENNVRKENFR